MNMEYYDIISELSEHHWEPFDVRDRIVLDLGCGRNWTKLPEHSSSFYFGISGANKVIGVDALQSEIDFLESFNTEKDKYLFICQRIESTSEIREMIKKFNISSLKSDIEGYEIVFYDMTFEDMKNIDTLAIEYHSNNILKKITAKIKEWGFNIHTLGKFTEHKDWYHLGSINVDINEMGVLFCQR